MCSVKMEGNKTKLNIEHAMIDVVKEMELKNQEIEELKESVEFWRRMADGRTPKAVEQVERPCNFLRECFVRIQNVKIARSYRPSENTLVQSHGDSDIGTMVSQERAGWDLEEEHGGQGGVGGGEEMKVVQGENKSNGSEVKQRKDQHVCNICNKSFIHLSKLKRHMVVHTGEKPYSCFVCLKSFSQVNTLNSHKLVHTGEQVHTCSICNKGFLFKWQLKRHELIHSGEKKYSCDICLKSFLRKDNLKSHKIFHFGEKVHHCITCDKTFFLKSGLKQHEVTHCGAKPFSCNVCLKSFSRGGNMKSHKLTHGGKKPHVCGICKKGFFRNEALETHEVKHMLEEQDEGRI